MIKHCPQFRDKLTNIKSLYSDYCLELEQVKNSKEYDQALSIQPKLTQAILELGMKVNPDKYSEVYLTEIERKNKANIPLTKAEVIFLYVALDKASDPRIKEILKTRNPKEDAPIVFDCQPGEIAYSQKEITENTKAYIGKWSVDIFQVARNYPSITHFYESFPDKKIFLQTLETDPKINSPAKAGQALGDKNIFIEWCRYILEKTEFSQTEEVYNLVRFTVEQLGFKQHATTDELYKRAQELGLELCPPEVGPQLRLQYTDREWFLIAMKQIAGLNGKPEVFLVASDRNNADLWLAGSEAGPGRRWRADDGFVFCFRREDKKEK